MFESTVGSAPSVEAAELLAVLGRLATVGGPSADRERIDVLAALEEIKCAAEGLQAQVAADLAEARRLQDEAAGVPRDRRARGLGHQVALARRESPWRGTRHVRLAQLAVRELPCAFAALRAGKLTEQHLAVLARETACLSRAQREHVDHMLASDLDKVERLTPKSLAAQAAKVAAELDPEAVVASRRIAEGERHTSLRPAPDAMTWFSAVLPVRDGIAVHVSLEQAAVRAQQMGDTRSKGQLMADTLVERVTGRPAMYEPAPVEEADRPPVEDVGAGRANRLETRASDRGADHSPGGVVVNLVMTDLQLFGTGPASEGAAYLEGFGPVDADLARQLAKDAERVWLRRLYTDPESGQLIAMDSRQRLFPDGLSRLIRLRDQVCRTPWCGAPIRETDHIVEYADAGATAYLNGQGLCTSCNHAKQDAWWARPGPDGTIEITTTTGHVYRSFPPEPPGPDEECVDDGHLTTTENDRPASGWLAPSWIAVGREQLIADGWTETTPAKPPVDCLCG